MTTPSAAQHFVQCLAGVVRQMEAIRNLDGLGCALPRTLRIRAGPIASGMLHRSPSFLGKTVVACLIVPGSDGPPRKQIRSFGTMTDNLRAL